MGFSQSKIFFFFIIGIIILASYYFINNPSENRYVVGTVVSTEGNPLPGAIVKLQGTDIETTTDEKGRFSLSFNRSIKTDNITAWKDRYYCWGTSLVEDRWKYSITLHPIPESDNPDYEWISSTDELRPENYTGHNGLESCTACHREIIEEWESNTHSKAAKNPVFLAFFNGDGPEDSHIGYKKDFPNSNGNCATCHIPAAALEAPFNTDPNEVTGVAAQGVFCDFCHKIKNVKIDNVGGRPGILSIQLQRPDSGYHIFYGQLNDVFSVDESTYNPLYSKSEYCAPCHHGKFWDNLVYPEYQEWLESSYAKKNITCQKCHMPPTGKMAMFAPAEKGAVARNPHTVSSHLQLGVKDEKFMRDSIEMDCGVSIDEEKLEVTVTIENTGAGHHYPTGSPMRNMVLVLEVRDAKGNELEHEEGERVPVWGGDGDVSEGNYAGLPGKGFAKVFKDITPYPGPRRVRHFPPVYPAPYWRPATLHYDSRIPAEGIDISHYSFKVLQDTHFPVIVDSKLIFRRTFKNWIDDMNIEVLDLELERVQISIKGG